MNEQALSVKEKIGYGMGDAASHIVFNYESLSRARQARSRMRSRALWLTPPS